MAAFDFEIYMCPKCGSVSVARKICNLCGTPTINTSLAVKDVVNGNAKDTEAVKTALDVLSSKYCDIAERKKYTSMRKANWRRSRGDIRRMLEKNIRICPRCGHIAGASCFYSNDVCCICGAKYIDGEISCQKYFNREKESDGYLRKVQTKLQERLCVKSTFYDTEAWNLRLDVEKDRLPVRLETKLEDVPLSSMMGIVPALLCIPGDYRKGKERIWNFFTAFQCYLSKYMFLLDNATGSENAKYLAQLREFLSDAFNILQLQVFAGQQDAVDMMSEYITDLGHQIYSLTWEELL